LKPYRISVCARVNDQVEDRDLWAVNLIEGSALSEQLMIDWFWATWPDRVELIFPVVADEVSIHRHVAEVEAVVANAPHLASKPELKWEIESNDV